MSYYTESAKHCGPKDHGFPPGTRVRYVHKPSGACADTAVVTRDRDLTVAVFESRYVFPIEVVDDGNGHTYYAQGAHLEIVAYPQE